MDLPLLLYLLVLALAFANGANDVSKSIATLAGSGVATVRTAILWGTLWTIVGAAASAFVATSLLRTFSRGLMASGAAIPPALPSAVLLAAMIWVLVSSRAGLPVSTTHALAGALAGAGLVAFHGRSQGLAWGGVGSSIALPLLLSPALALILTMMVHPLVRTVATRWEGTCLCLMPASRALVTVDARGMTRTLLQASAVGRPVVAVPAECDRSDLRGLSVGLDTVHWISSGLTSLARGMNDAPKIVALLLLGHLAAPLPHPSLHALAFGGVALAMGVGSYVGGARVTERLANQVTRMNHAEGLTANLATSSLVLLSSTLGMPVSTTHVSASAIMGIGWVKGSQAVQWSTVREMVLAWVVTLPIAAVLGLLVYLLLSRMF